MENFSFNFFGAVGSQANSDPVAYTSSTEEGVTAEEVPQQQGLKVKDEPSIVTLDNEVALLKGVVTSEQAAAALAEPELQASDLVPRKYEGGFKLWEGAVDLCNFLIQQHQLTPQLLQEQTPRTSLRGKKVLELGCGHGLPGILCQLAGATVHYQDFNKQVITSLTIPNVRANLARLEQGVCREGARYFAGDWEAVGHMMAMHGLGGYYDIILTAETIYSRESQARLLSCIKQVLQPPHGVVYVAAKSFYFGVGGSTASFTDLVKADGILECTQVWKVEDGQSNKREILKLNFPEAITPYFL
uniref:protein-histidine N-methyltransferase n=1 Tax=Tetradesmus obliquus TaxID=3088 RepID=A0A383V6Z2_TETOB|eukprot:jgi/Sobl393_1/19031/SZX60562.1